VLVGLAPAAAAQPQAPPGRARCHLPSTAPLTLLHARHRRRHHHCHNHLPPSHPADGHGRRALRGAAERGAGADGALWRAAEAAPLAGGLADASLHLPLQLCQVGWLVGGLVGGWCRGAWQAGDAGAELARVT
jgi:hypothetical protein